MATVTNQGEKRQQQDPWFLRSTAPVFLPAHHALTLPESSFEEFLREDLKLVAGDEGTTRGTQVSENPNVFTGSDTETVLVPSEVVAMSEISTTGDIREHFDTMAVDKTDSKAALASENNHPFMQGLLSHGQDSRATAETENKMLTENAGIAYRSTTDPLLDLFYELEDVVSGPRLLELLDSAWRADSTATLKMIFNARSIHLGKASRPTFYRCAGWLADNHPQTLFANLPWLSRPVIQKKKAKSQDEDQQADAEDIVIIEKEVDEDDPSRFDVKNGVAHGYWKDLLNLLALRANDKLDVLADPRDVLNTEREYRRFKWPKTQDEAKSIRHDKRDERHTNAVRLFTEDPVYRGLHLSIARLFAAQLKADLALLRSDNAAAKRTISLCAKWAPSAERFHDKHTFVVSSIAEALHPPLSGFLGDQYHDPPAASVDQRTVYLRHAREAYRRDVAALRKHLEVVERDITAGSFENIKYDRVPSAAMNNYAALFATKDVARFEAYVDKVAAGKARISGATLLPSTLIRAVRHGQGGNISGESLDALASSSSRRKGARDLVQAKVSELAASTLDLQWDTLVRRVRDAGALENCIAVADVSGSMCSPVFPDGTCPMDSSIGLSLLIAEVTKPPFGGAFITFSTRPAVEAVDLSRPLRDKYRQLSRAAWGMSTDLVAVFEKLILPMALEHAIEPEDMVGRVFVFSDMQFDSAAGAGGQGDWATSYERIERQFRDAGYEMPELVFWNLAGGRAGYVEPPWKQQRRVSGDGGGGGGDPVAPKPVAAGETGVALVSGYSQGLLKVFLDSGSFEDEEVEEVEGVENSIGDDGEVVVVEKVKRRKLDPMSIVRKAIGHEAYSMLRVVD